MGIDKILAALLWTVIVFYTGLYVGREQMEDKCHEEVKPYIELLLGCLNNGQFYFPDTLEAFRCDTTYLGNLKGPYKNEPSR